MANEVVIQDRTSPTKEFPTAIQKIKGDKETQKIQDWLQKTFINGKPYKKMMLVGRAQYQGIDPQMASMFNMTKQAADLPKLMSMMVLKAANIVGGRWYEAFVSGHGDYCRGLAEKFGGVDEAEALQYTMNHYWRKKQNCRRTLYTLFRSAFIDGSSVSRQNWMYRERAFLTPVRGNFLKLNPMNGKLLQPKKMFDKQTIITDDRPDFSYVDPLFFEIEPGCTDLGPDGATFAVEKKIMSRKEIKKMIRQGRMDKTFLSLTEKDIGGKHSNGFEAREMRDFYDDLFNGKLNDGIKFEDDEYKFIIDWVWQDGDEENPTTSYKMLNGNCLSKEAWIGGPFIPYQIYSYIPSQKTWIGMSGPESMQDKLREYTYVMNISIRDARRDGLISTAIPAAAALDKESLQEFLEGKPFKYDDLGAGVNAKDAFVQLKHGESSSGILAMREWLSQQMMEDLGISIQETAGGGVPSALRSGKVIQSFNEQGGRVANMYTSLMGEALTNMMNQMKYLIYTLQSEPIEVVITGNQNLMTVGTRTLNAIPDIMLYPNINMAQLTSDMLNTTTQFLPFMNGLIDPTKMLKFIFEYGVSPELGRKFNEVLAQTPQLAVPMSGPQAAAGGQLGPGNPG